MSARSDFLARIERNRAAMRLYAGNAHQRYEARKAAWIEAHPEATPREYEQAIMKITREFGI